MIGLEVLVTAQAPMPAELTPAPAELTESGLAVPTEPVEPTATSLLKLHQQLDSLIHMLSDWKKSIKGWSTCVRGEWAAEREHLASAKEEWKVWCRLWRVCEVV
jgi:hypothetical protein